MILAIDIGNTTVAFYGAKERDCGKEVDICFSFKLKTDGTWSAQQYREAFLRQMEKIPQSETVEWVVIASVVPKVCAQIRSAMEMIYAGEVVELTADDNHMLHMEVANPAQVGFDRIVDAAWAASHYPLPVITVDMGTATTINVIAEGMRFLGGAIAPGILTGANALSSKAAKLPQIELQIPAHVIGKDTVSCMQAGTVVGAAVMVDGMIDRMEEELGRSATVVMTGGGAEIVHTICRHAHIYEPELLAKGLVLLAANRREKQNAGTVFSAIGVERLRMGIDGEGVTTLVAGYGCPLRCDYCLNPQCFWESFRPKIYTVETLLAQVAMDDLYFQATGGGIVFGGGEPLLQADFIHEFRRRCPKEWKLTLETSLNVPQTVLEKVVGDIDYYLVDCKDMDAGIYERYTGKSQAYLLANLKYLLRHADPSHIQIRIPLIPEYNTQEDQRKSVEMLREMGFSNLETFSYNVETARQKGQRKGNKTG